MQVDVGFDGKFDARILVKVGDGVGDARLNDLRFGAFREQCCQESLVGFSLDESLIDPQHLL